MIRVRKTLIAVLALSAFAAPAATALPRLSDLTRRAAPTVSALADPGAITPRPRQVDRGEGRFVVRSGMVLAVPPGDTAARWTADWLTELLARTRGLRLQVRETGESAPGAIRINRTLHRGVQPDEAYDLQVSPEGIEIAADSDAGLFYGAVSLWQILTQDEGKVSEIAVRSGHVRDEPQFGWRGLLLDSARHYQSVGFIEQLIDAMAQRKLNVLHWHLNDDQAWRLEIRKYPRLTEVGAWRVPAGDGARADIDPATGKPRLEGGFYTQDQVREIVRYARARNVTVVPEIEMPGHASAAIAAYPELASIPNPPRYVPADWGVYPNLYNTDDRTVGFLQDVLGEVMELFPSRYIHMGGDEAVKDQWKASASEQAKIRALGIKDEEALQSRFTGRVDGFLNDHGRRLIGWDDILKGGLTPGATVMSWQGPAGAVAAASQGHDTIMAVDPTLYFDHRQSGTVDEPPGRGSLLTLRDVYAFDPLPASLDPAQRSHVLGLEGALWTEHVRTEDRAAWMAFPRLDAIAEIGWSGPGAWPDFLARMPAETGRYRMTGIKASDSAFAPEIVAEETGGSVKVTASNQTGFGDLRYSLDGSAPTPRSPKYQAPLTLKLPVRFTAQAFDGARPLSRPIERRWDALSIRRRDSRELKTCSGKLELALEDDAPARGDRAVFLVDILKPCWIWPAADLNGIAALRAEVGQLPYNFQIGDLVKSITFRAPATPEGELEVRLDSCEGERIAVLPLKPASGRFDTTVLPEAPIAARAGRHDLCFTFTQAGVDPMWVIRNVGLVPASTPAKPFTWPDLGRFVRRGPKP